MATTIQVSNHVKEHLDRLKTQPRETYDQLIDRILEDFEELSEETKKRIRQAELDIAQGRLISHERVKQELDIP